MSNWRYFVFVAVVGLAFGCNQSGGSDSTTTTTGTATASGGDSKSSGSPVEVAFVTNNASNYWVIAKSGTEKAVSELGGPDKVKVDFEIPPNGTAAEQKQIITDMLTKGVKGIAISPKDPADETSLINDAAKQALVITQDSDAPASNRACYIGSDNHAAGVQAGEELKKALPTGGNVMVFVGDKGAANAAERLKGVQDAIAGTNIKILDVRTDQADHALAKKNAADEIVKDPSIKCMVGLWSYNGPAILGAVKDAGLQGKMKIVCFDGDDDTIQGVKDGFIEATIVQQPFQFGHDAVVDMVKSLNGDKSVFPANKLIYVPTQAITKANVDQYVADTNKMLGK